MEQYYYELLFLNSAIRPVYSILVFGIIISSDMNPEGMRQCLHKKINALGAAMIGIEKQQSSIIVVERENTRWTEIFSDQVILKN